MGKGRNQSIKNKRELENFIDQALQIHSVISIEVSRQLFLELKNPNGSPEKKTKLRQTLALIDQLDSFLESPDQIKHFYLSLQLKLFDLLKELEIPFPV